MSRIAATSAPSWRVYEVVGVRDGKLIDEALHLDRLDRSSA